MPRKLYTILILPHAQSRFRKLHLSRNFLLVLAGIVVLLVAAGTSVPHLVFKLHAQSLAMAKLQEQNRKLRDEKVSFEASLDSLSRDLSTYETSARRLATALGLDDLPTARPATGGAATSGRALSGGVQPLLDEELSALRSRTEALGGSVGVLDRAFEQRTRMLACTPNMSPVSGFYSEGYGWRKDPFTGKREFHQGVDIVAPYGAPVRAPADGVVTRAGRKGGYGKMVHISHGYGLASRYGHLSEILVRPGQKVHRGDVIGRVGSTGRSTGPHLHYEVFKEGRRVNPRKYLGDRRF